MSLKKKYLNETAQKAVKGMNVELRLLSDSDKYSKVRYASIYKGYDFLEDLFAISTYIKKKHNIPQRFFQIMLKMMGMRLFTMADLAALPKNFRYNKLNNILDTGYVAIVQEDKKQSYKTVYSLNAKGKKIVIEFYQYLSGEKRIPIDKHNPMVNEKTSIPYDKKKVDVFKRLKDLPVKEHHKYLFED